MPPPLRIGTRASKLALAQAEMLRAALVAAHGLPEAAIELVAMSTAGDRELHKDPVHWGYKGLFTKELEDALLDRRIDLAVHSMKDMPSVLPDGLIVAAVLERADVRDAWVSRVHPSYEELRPHVIVGTSSARRAAQLKHRHPTVTLVPLRGNVPTRLQKIADGVAEGTFLACAGLQRLQLQEHIRMPIAVESMLPAVAQGAIGMECRADDNRVRALLAPLNHGPTGICIDAERAFLRVLDGSCKTPIAGLAVIEGEQLWLRGEVLSHDGALRHFREQRGALSDAVKLGEALGVELHAVAGALLR